MDATVFLLVMLVNHSIHCLNCIYVRYVGSQTSLRLTSLRRSKGQSFYGKEVERGLEIRHERSEE